jgi:RHS repeat-associated protein
MQEYPDTSGTAISYDANGNMKDHKDKGILQIDYNILDLPDLVKFDKTYVPRFTGMELDYNVKTKYLYRADGVKLRKIYNYGIGRANLEASTITDYLDGFQYEEKYTGSLSSPVLKFVQTSEGYYDFEKNKYIYTYTDHLGNVRLSYARNTTSGSAEVLEENSYYPFGLRHDTNILSVNNSSYKYQYNGKELQTETGWNDYGARMYMSDIARWGVIDPLSETARRFSPYNYAYDNPISFVDPDGRKAMAPNNWEWNNPMGGALGYMLGGGSATFGSFAEFLGEENPLAKFNNRETGGGAGLSSFSGTEASYDEVMNFLGISQPTYFQGIDFSQFGEGTNNDGNPAAFWYFDKKGEQLMNHWLGGSGKNLSFSYDKSWTNYMSKNGFVQDELYKRALARSYMMYSEKKATYSETSGNFHFEIDNTYNTGYGMLHGTKYFSYVLNGTYDKKSDSYIFKYNLKWTDQINHNQNVLLDRAFNSFTRAVAHPKDYWITIKWTQTIIIKSKEWEELH